jgi:hypothetical protein
MKTKHQYNLCKKGILLDFFGEAAIDYKNYAFLTLSGRQDWARFE